MNTIYFDIYENKFEKGDKLKHYVFEIKNVNNKFYEYPFKAVLKMDLSSTTFVKGFTFDKSTLLEFINTRLKTNPSVLKLQDLKNEDTETTGFLIATESFTTIFDVMRLIADIACDLFKQLNGILCYDSKFETNIENVKNKYAIDALTNSKKEDYAYKFIDFSKNDLTVECFGLLPKMFSVVF